MAETAKRILIVDDNEEIHEDFRKILSPALKKKDNETLSLEKELFGDENAGNGAIGDVGLSYRIDDAMQGEAAIEMVDRAEREGDPYALAFMDIRMPPGIDGVVTIERLWKKHPMLEIVICTAYSDYSWDQMLQRLGSSDHLLFIKKPFDGIAVKQITLSLTTKWEVNRKNAAYTGTLEAEVEKRTADLRAMMEDLRELKEKAESATRAKSEFLANMSHEIRTPMNAVIGFCELLKNTVLTEQQEDFIETISTSGELLISLINDILDISKIESRKIALEEIDFDLEYLVGSVLKILRQRAIGKNLELTMRYPDNVSRNLKGDPTRIRQILMNLVGNAIKFTDQGNIVVTLGFETDGKIGTTDAPIIRISVKDTGIGITEDQQKSIFDPFTQADSSITRKYGGTGLGLTITKSLIEMMGGSIAVHSDTGKGTEFVFTLLLKPGQPSIEKEIVLIGLEYLKEKNVLIVDDNGQSREILFNYCGMIGMNVLKSASSVNDAFTWLTEEGNRVDIVLSDIMMPLMDGYAFARKIKAEDRLKEMKLIALTSDAVPGAADDAGKAGFDAFLSKPFTRMELYEILQAVFGDTRKEKHEIITRHIARELLTKGISVLLVEDNVINRKLMGLLLQQMGCVFEMANNGREAVEKAEKNKFDCILMDLQMPVMDGYEATKKICGQQADHPPIIALTAHVFQEDAGKCKAAGMVDFLTKPVDLKALREMILKWAGRQGHSDLSNP
jgi:signal transduction histidine kinase/DNA-binding response OmpR family regulator